MNQARKRAVSFLIFVSCLIGYSASARADLTAIRTEAEYTIFADSSQFSSVSNLKALNTGASSGFSGATFLSDVSSFVKVVANNGFRITDIAVTADFFGKLWPTAMHGASSASGFETTWLGFTNGNIISTSYSGYGSGRVDRSAVGDFSYATTISTSFTSVEAAELSFLHIWGGVYGYSSEIGGKSGGYLQFDNLRFNVSVTAVPEPETYALMFAGLGLVGVIARRRKAKQTA